MELMRRLLLALSALTLLAATASAQEIRVGNNPSFVTTGGTALRSAADRAAATVNVKDFGAKGDGTTDDAASINAAFAYARTLPTTAAGSSAVVLFPQGTYRVLSGINATNLTGLAIVGEGAAISAATNGSAALDMLGDYGVELRGLAIVGDAASPPSTGIQMGRYLSGLGATGRNTLRRVATYGSFTLAALYDMASETTLFDKLNVNNSYAGGYALIDDGINHFSLASAFVTPNLPADTPFTNTNALFSGCVFLANGTGSNAVWIANANAHRFSGAYVYAPGYGMVLYQASNSRNAAIDFAGTVEGITDIFYVAGQSPAAINGLRYLNPVTNATASILRTDPAVTLVNLRDAHLSVGSVPGGTVWFSSPTAWNMTGDVYASDNTGWTAPTAYVGWTDFGLARSYYGASVLTVGSGSSVSNNGLVAIGPSASSSSSSTASIAIGSSATASGSGGIAIGSNASAASTSGIAIGDSAATTTLGKFATASGKFATAGDAQGATTLLRISTSSTSTARLTANGSATVGSTNTINMPNNSAFLVNVEMEGRDTTTGDAAAWTCGPFLMTTGANQTTVSVKGSPTCTSVFNTGGGSVAGMAAPTIAADTTNGGFNLSLTPASTNASHWVARVRTVEVQ